MKKIKIEGARIHNLQNITVELPKNKLIVATGVSGSGKSSIMFDIIFEEGRKQYLESLGMQLGSNDKDVFDRIEGLSPAVAVQQSIIRQSNPRSTVGTKTGILNLLALVYAADGRITCSGCEKLVDEHLFCETCQVEVERFQPSYFSYNAAEGMCLTCSGHGSYFEVNISALVTDEQMTVKRLYDKALITSGYLRVLFKRFGEYWDTPFQKLSTAVQQDILYGHYEHGKMTYSIKKCFESRKQKGEDLQGLYHEVTCSECHGYRVGEEARSVFLAGKHIGHLGQLSISALADFLENIKKQNILSQYSKNIISDITNKVQKLITARLGYITLYRSMPTLSGGELQRLFLHGHLDSKMDALIYVLDEPTSGLHEIEKAAILEAIEDLRKLGNTVIVVEHDKKTIEIADHIIDIGPKAGKEGGKIVYQGDVAGLLKAKQSITGQYLSGARTFPLRISQRNKAALNVLPKLTVYNGSINNLKDVTVDFPLGALVGVAGMSGSGKSSLIFEVLLPLIKSSKRKQEKAFYESQDNADWSRLEGYENIDDFIEISQAPIGRSKNSNPISYIGVWDKIRELFATTTTAKKLNLSAGDFSFNSKGACDTCQGNGKESLWLGTNMTIEKQCVSCQGKRFNETTLTVKYKQKTIFDVLEMSIEDASIFFQDIPRVDKALKVLEKIGMGYIKLGQPTTTLSGGEAQRIKLAKEIGRKRKGNILYVLDEPTTGLSSYDTAKLLGLLDNLILQGNSIFVIEHDIELLKCCDWLIELGPEGGSNGGYVIAQGSPEDLKINPNSLTGRFL